MSFDWGLPPIAAANDENDVASFNGVLVVWRQANIWYAYASDTTTLRLRRSRYLFGFPTLAEWLCRAPRRAGSPFVDWSSVEFDEVLTLGMRTLGESGVPAHVFVEWEEQARVAMLADERKSSYQFYLDDLGGWRPSRAPSPQIRVAPRGARFEPAVVAAKAARVRRACSFHPVPPVIAGLPDELAEVAIVFEVLGDADDGVRLDMVTHLGVDDSRGLLELATPAVGAIDSWLATPPPGHTSELYATVTATRIGLEHLAVRLNLLDAGPEALELRQHSTDDAQFALLLDHARAGACIWSHDARIAGDKIEPNIDEFEPMLDDVFDAVTVNALLLFKEERRLGHSRFAHDAVPPSLIPLLRYAELLDVGGDLATQISASELLSGRSQSRLVSLAEPLLPPLNNWFASIALRGEPLSRTAAAMFTLMNVVNHLRAPLGQRLRVE